MLRIVTVLVFAMLSAVACDADDRLSGTASGLSQEAPLSAIPEETVADATRQASSSAMIEWLQPPIPELPLRSEEEKQRGMEIGRELPQPELLQPALDSGLSEFRPRLNKDAMGTFIGGASDVLPQLVTSWIQAFNTYYPGVRIEIGKPYAGSLGMLEVIDGAYDFVFVSRELKPTDIASFNERHGYDPFTVPVAGGSYRHYGFLDALGFFVHVDNPLNQLTFEQIDRLFSSTRHRGGEAISTWGQLGLQGEWENRPIHLYGVEPWNGFEEFVRQRVLDFDGKRGEWRTDINFSRTAFPVAAQVADDPLGIGYTGLAYLTQGVRMLPLSVSGESGTFLAPSYEHVAGASYPLSRLIYFNANRAPGEPFEPILHEFITFILSRQGQQIVLDQAVYLPLRDWQAADSRAILD